ncbi:MAG: hypothetical protein JJU11_05580 [Candidatus Sumerlaeia bacterium]|nr:hypothetical protein [Candidatus Sumerlaeia bacterium]
MFSSILLVCSLLLSSHGTEPQEGTEPNLEARFSIPVILQQQQVTVYTRRDGTVVRAGTGPRDAVVAELDRGAPLRVINEDRMRYEVRTPNGKTGFIARLNVTDVAPATGGTGGMFSVRDDLGAGQRSNVTAIRGLSPTSEELGGKEVPTETIESYKKVKDLSARITRDQLDAFAAEGGIDPL